MGGNRQKSMEQNRNPYIYKIICIKNQSNSSNQR